MITDSDRRACAECTEAEFEALLMHRANRVKPDSHMAAALKLVMVQGSEVAEAALAAGLSKSWGRDRGRRTKRNGVRGLQRTLKEWRNRLPGIRFPPDLDEDADTD